MSGNLFQFRPINNAYWKSNLENNLMVFNSIKNFNDPFEGYHLAHNLFWKDGNIVSSEEAKPLHETLAKFVMEKLDNFPLKEDYFDENVLRRLNKKYRITCLTSEVEDVLMWSHYGDSHKGICVEYDRDVLSSISRDISLHKVEYDQKGYVIYPEKLQKSPEEILIHKNKRWDYEKEERLVWKLSDKAFYANERLVTEVPFVSITVGVSTPDDIKDMIFKLCREKKIVYYEMTIKEDSLEHRPILREI